MSDEIKKGLLGIVVDETEVSKVMPEINSLTYRGYAAQDLCAKCKFEEVAYLILNGELPTKKQLKKFEKEERKERKLSKTLLDGIKKFPKNAIYMRYFYKDIFLIIIYFKTSSGESGDEFWWFFEVIYLFFSKKYINYYENLLNIS